MKIMSHDGHLNRPNECTRLRIGTSSGTQAVSKGDWIIRNIIKGEFYSCNSEIFHDIFESIA